MKKEKIYNKIIRIIREMYEIQTPVIKDVKEILIKKGYTVNYSGAMSPYSGAINYLMQQEKNIRY